MVNYDSDGYLYFLRERQAEGASETTVQREWASFTDRQREYYEVQAQ